MLHIGLDVHWRLTGGRRERRKIAWVAMAHWLVRCMQAMLCSGEGWREAA